MITVFKNKNDRNIFLVFLVSVFLFYGNTLKNKYSLDDDFVTVVNFPEKGKPYTPSNALVSQGFSKIGKIWTSRYAHDGEGSFDYRPVVTTTFAIEYGIFGQNPFISHAINLLLYALVIWLIYRSILKMFRDQPYKETLAFLCAFIFLIHPLHTEVVSSLKSRDEILAFGFGLLAMYQGFLLVDTLKWKHGAFLALFLLVGILSKRTAIVYMALIPLSLFFFRGFSLKRLGVIAASLLVMYIGYALIRKMVISEKTIRHFYHFESFMFTEKLTFLQKIGVAFNTYGFYIKMLLFPYPLRFYYGEAPIDFRPGFTWQLLVALAFLGGSAVYYFKTKNKYFLYGFLAFSGSIFPFLNLATPVAGIVGERLAFMASFGFCLMLALVLLNYFEGVSLKQISLKTFTTGSYMYLSVITLICLVYVFKRNGDWYNKFTLFSHDSEYLEHSSKGNSLLANEYFERMNSSTSPQQGANDAKLALKHYQLAIKADSSMFSACNNAGVVLFSMYKNYDDAAKYFSLAIKAKPLYAQAYENLANTRKIKSDYDSARVLYRKAIEIDPNKYASYDAIAQTYIEQKNYKGAEQAYDAALKKFAGDYYFETQKANTIFADGREAEALAAFEEAFTLNPNRELGEFMARKFKEKGDTKKAEYYLNYMYSR